MLADHFGKIVAEGAEGMRLKMRKDAKRRENVPIFLRKMKSCNS
jgi:hypothetical protein